MNRGGVGARSLNIELHAALNPAGDRKVERFGWTFAPGDKVMQIENDYDKQVYNGDIGYIDDVDPQCGRDRTTPPSIRNVFAHSQRRVRVPYSVLILEKTSPPTDFQKNGKAPRERFDFALKRATWRTERSARIPAYPFHHVVK